MALTLQTQFSKKCGLPNFSSISASASVEVEIRDLESIPSEIAKLYHVLQSSVDAQLAEHVGFVPGDDYGESSAASPQRQISPNGNGHTNGNGRHDHRSVEEILTNGKWQCSDKQRSLILELQKRLGLSDADLDARSRRLSTRPVHQLTKLSASNLISELLEEAGNGNGKRNGSSSETTAR